MEKITLKAFVNRCNAFCTQALEGAAELAMSNGHYEIGVEHFLLKLASTDSDFVNALAHYDVNLIGFIQDLHHQIEAMKSGNVDRPAFSRPLSGLLEDAWLVASLEQNLAQIRTGSILLAILANTRRHGLADYIDSLSNVPYDELLQQFDSIVGQSPETQLQQLVQSSNSSSAQNTLAGRTNSHVAQQDLLDKYCTNFTKKAREGGIDPVFCRDQEIRQMVDVLARRRKNNPICVGEAGVGKTSLIEGLALKIVEQDVPDILFNVDILGLDLTLLQSGASVKGEFEKRLQGVIDAIKQSATPIILFIDEAHTLIGAGGSAGTNDAANILKPALARGELRTVAATTWSEYKKYFEKDPALSRRFQLIKVEEPTPEQAVVILRGLRPVYERAHEVYVRDDAIIAAAKFSDRYISGRQLPDKAIDVLDTAAARVKVSLHAKPDALDSLERAIQTLERERNAISRDVQAGVSDQSDHLAVLHSEIETKQAQAKVLTTRWQQEKTLAQQIIETRSFSAESTSEASQETANQPAKSQTNEASKQTEAALKAELHALQGENPLVHFEVSPQIVSEVIANWTGIPVGKMEKDHAATVLSFAQNLKQKIKGQDHAIAEIDKGIRAAKAGINNPDAPLGVYLLVGPSGIGKTETCLTTADLLFGSEQYLTTINMSEFQEKHSVSRLVGSPPGYVGYGEGGVLTEAVRQKPYSAVLLDEVEKADLDVMNLFYQVFDKGVLSDGEGQLVNFRNTVLFLTSNLASDVITDLFLDASEKSLPLPEKDQVLSAIRPILSRHFKPALLARMQIVPFFPVQESVLADICRMKLNKIRQRLQDAHKLECDFPEQVITNIVQRCKEVETGARNIDHLINGQLLPQLASTILAGFDSDAVHQRITVDIADDGQFITELQ